MEIDERKLARQMQAADERRRRERRGKLAQKAIGMQLLRTSHKELHRPSRGDVERAVGYNVCSVLGSRPKDDPIRMLLETNVLDLLVEAGFDRSESGGVLQNMIKTASRGRKRWLIKRETDRRLARLLAE